MTVLELATQDDGIFLYPERSIGADRAQALAVDLGCSWLRLNVYADYLWRMGWGPWDDAVDRARAAGMQVQLTITGQPRWSNKGESGGLSYIDPDPAAFADYAAMVADHFKGRVKRFSLWNEPNHPAFLKADDTAGLYGKLYRAAYPRVLKEVPDAQVLFGEISGGIGARAFIAEALAGHKTLASGIAIHPYQYQSNPSTPQPGDNLRWASIPIFQRNLERYRHDGRFRTRAGKAVPVYVTEMGYFSPGEPRGISEGARAAYVATNIRQAREWGLRQYLYYSLVETPDASWNSGIVKPDGTPTATYSSLKEAYAKL